MRSSLPTTWKEFQNQESPAGRLPEPRPLAAAGYLDARRHGDVEVTQNVLRVLVFGAFPQERQKTRSLFVGVPDLREAIEKKESKRRRRRRRRRGRGD